MAILANCVPLAFYCTKDGWQGRGDLHQASDFPMVSVCVFARTGGLAGPASGGPPPFPLAEFEGENSFQFFWPH